MLENEHQIKDIVQIQCNYTDSTDNHIHVGGMERSLRVAKKQLPVKWGALQLNKDPGAEKL